AVAERRSNDGQIAQPRNLVFDLVVNLGDDASQKDRFAIRGGHGGFQVLRLVTRAERSIAQREHRRIDRRDFWDHAHDDAAVGSDARRDLHRNTQGHMGDRWGRHDAGGNRWRARYDREIRDGLDDRGLIVERRELRPAEDGEAVLNLQRPDQNAYHARVGGEGIAAQTADRGDAAHTQISQALDTKRPRGDARV